ncbi:MAG: cytochrome c [Alphaproteobacteria bacterium]|nr:cytochrome c [Alphaproteobacteria bacterium]
MTPAARNVLIGALGMLLLLAATGLLIVLTGGYNIAATDRHNPIVGWALTTTMRNHVQGAADDLTAPGAITPAMIAAGAGEYKAMCAHCHGGIGASRAEWAKTMRPLPPALAHAAQRWSIEEVHWLVKHGVKMSGMPAFGPTHDDATIWNIAAFVKAMPDIDASDYAALTAAGQRDGGGHSHAPGAPAHAD